MSDETRKEICQECNELEGGGRHTPPHKNLMHKDSKRVSSIMGAADEDYYVCRTCGHKWMHETGSCGMGWIK